MLEFLAGTGAGVLLALLLGHLERRRVTRRQRRLALLHEDMTRRAWRVQDATARDADDEVLAALRDRRNVAANAYYTALMG